MMKLFTFFDVVHLSEFFHWSDFNVHYLTSPSGCLFRHRSDSTSCLITLIKIVMSHNLKFESCIQACLTCASVCNHCASACLQEKDIKMLARCIQLDMECASICYTAGEVMSLNGKYADKLCALCAEICTECAAECEKHAQHGMDHCRECAEACRRCADECRKVAA